MKEKKLMVMTSFGPVPYEAIKQYIPEQIREAYESLMKEADKVKHSIPMNLDYYIDRIADNMKCDGLLAKAVLEKIWLDNPASVFSMLLRAIAIEIDKRYEDHISKSEDIFCISTLDGRIHKVCKAHIKNYKNFAAFRSIEDARIACRILRDFMRYLFK